jgi:toxin-antitoxin system PIN domain toxin
VIAVDSNILVYAHRPDMPLHAQARTAVRDLATARPAWAVPWACLHEFYGTVTSRRVFTQPSGITEALDQIDAWLESPSLQLLSETQGHRRVLGELLTGAQVTGPVVHDARIAAICLSHGVDELLTEDRDFARFRELRLRHLDR